MKGDRLNRVYLGVVDTLGYSWSVTNLHVPFEPGLHVGRHLLQSSSERCRQVPLVVRPLDFRMALPVALHGSSLSSNISATLPASTTDSPAI